MVQGRTIRAAEITDYGITLIKVSPRFVTAVEDLEEGLGPLAGPRASLPDAPPGAAQVPDPTAIQTEASAWGPPIPAHASSSTPSSGEVTGTGIGRHSRTPDLYRRPKRFWIFPTVVLVGFLLVLCLGLVAWLRNQNEPDVDYGLRAFNQEEPVTPDRQADVSFNHGLDALRKEDNNRAVECFSESIRLNPRFADAYHNRGLAHFRNQSFDAALADLDQAVHLTPKGLESHLLRVNILVQMGRPQRAIDEYSDLINREPDNPIGYCARADAYNMLESFERSISDCDKAIQLDRQIHAAFACRGYGYLLRGDALGQEKDFRQAVADFTEAIRLKPGSLRCYLGRAQAYRALGDEASAARDEQKVGGRAR
jgi:Tfp pilus assembly protein PilF